MTALTIISPVANTRSNRNRLSIDLLKKHYDVKVFEVFNVSEVARARNIVATMAWEHVEKVSGLVFWLDADISLLDIETFNLHVECVISTGHPISGAYVTRQDKSNLAHRVTSLVSTTHQLNPGRTVDLVKSYTGLGCLLMNSSTFLKQLHGSPFRNVVVGGKKIREYFVCCPRIEKDVNGEDTMIGEDFDYCRSLGGVFLTTVRGPHGEVISILPYGHTGEVMHLP